MRPPDALERGRLAGNGVRGRTWSMTAHVECRLAACDERDTATCEAVGAHDATEAVKYILRGRGWTIDRRDNVCPKHAGPIPPCDLCGTPTPKPYGLRRSHITKAEWSCWTCYDEKFAELRARNWREAE